MHRYMQSFSDMFAGIHNDGVTQVWRDLVPAMAIRHPFLLHTLYATTALHAIVTDEITKAKIVPTTTTGGTSPESSTPSMTGLIASYPPVISSLDLEEMRAAYQHYFGLAVREHRIEVANLTKDNADSVCMATILISNQGFILDHENSEPYAPPLQWLVLASSIRAVVDACEGLLEPDSALRRMSDTNRSLSLQNVDNPETAAFFEPLMQFQAHLELADRETYQKVVNLLGSLHRSAELCEPFRLLSRRFLSFAPLIPTTFIDLVRRCRPRALVLLACFFALTRVANNIWWFRGAAVRHVAGLRALVPSDWNWAFEWIDGMAFSNDSASRSQFLRRRNMCAAPVVE